jgi:hypothetical protein
METIIFIIICLVWLICSIVSYIITTNDLNNFITWTKGDRVFCILFSIFGPISLVNAIAFWFSNKEDRRKVKKIISDIKKLSEKR